MYIGSKILKLHWAHISITTCLLIIYLLFIYNFLAEKRIVYSLFDSVLNFQHNLKSCLYAS